MDKNYFSPYVRLAMFSTIQPPFLIRERIIYDYELIFVRDGKSRLTVAGTEYICQRNDIVFIRPGIPHKFENFGDCVFEQPHIHFDVCYWEHSLKTPVSFKNINEMSAEERSWIQKDVFQDYDIPFVFRAADPEAFQKVFFDVLRTFISNGVGKELLLKAKMLELLQIILAQFEHKGSEFDGSYIRPEVLVRDYIDNNFLNPLTLDQLTGLFHVNVYTLLRNFKKHYGCSVIAYYNGKRFEYAKHLLETTNMSVSAISEQLNMADVYVFSKFFKKYEGISPRDYRKKTGYEA